MARDLPHLVLPELEFSAERRRRQGGGRAKPRGDPLAHAARIAGELTDVAGQLVVRRSNPPLGINPRLVFRIDLQPGAGLDDTKLAGMGLHILAADGLGRIVVFPDDETVGRLRDHIRVYSETQGKRYGDINAVELVRPLGPEDRVGRRLRRRPLDEQEVASLDVELWHTGDRLEMLELVDQIRGAFGGSVTDQYVGRSVCLLRMRLSKATLSNLLTVDHVKEIDRRPSPSFEILAVTKVALDELVVGPPPEIDAPAIVVVDSGIAPGHPLLEHLLLERKSFVSGDGASHTSGHGTWVGGIAAYGDVGEALAQGSFEPKVWLLSARVTDKGDGYDPDRLLESQLRELVVHYTTEYASAKVFNISLGDLDSPYVEGGLQFRLAAVVDELAYEFRDHEIIFVISSGNLRCDINVEDLRTEYPGLLLEPASRIIDPATACLAITVGGLSYGEAAGPQLTLDLVDRNIAEREWPSPFTRSGFGLGGSLKPELVEYAGDAHFSAVVRASSRGGLPTTSHLFAPPEGELLRIVAGTSFAAPRVAYFAARLFDVFPDASSNLVRALLADSAEVPADRPDLLRGLSETEPSVLRVYGYGQPSYSRASASERNDVLLLADSTMDLDWVRLYEIPPLPREFRATPGRGRISVTLAYDPPTRHTRTKDYLGVRMQFALFRNTPADAIFSAVRAWSEDEREELEGETLPGMGGLSRAAIEMKPGPRFRNLGTLQRAHRSVSGLQWTYDEGPLILAVACQRRWAPADITSQRFAVVVSVRHDDPAVDLYSALQLRARAYERVRVRA